MAPLIRFSQVNQAATDRLPIGERMRERTLALVALLADPEADLTRQFEAQLAVIAVMLGNVPFPFALDASDEQRSAIALEVATRLISE